MQLGGSDTGASSTATSTRLLDLPIQDSLGVAHGVRESAVCIVRGDDLLRIRLAAIADRPRSGYELSLTRPPCGAHDQWHVTANRSWTPLRVWVEVSPSQAVGNEHGERLSRWVSPADAKRVPGWVGVHLITLVAT